ncbi:MAG: hypothetical protein WCF07_05860, partial [Nitrososphaeraceae archaeon]
PTLEGWKYTKPFFFLLLNRFLQKRGLMSRPPIVAKEIQISHNDTIFTNQVTLVGESTQVPPPSPQLVDTLKIVTVVTSFLSG